MGGSQWRRGQCGRAVCQPCSGEALFNNPVGDGTWGQAEGLRNLQGHTSGAHPVLHRGRAQLWLYPEAWIVKIEYCAHLFGYNVVHLIGMTDLSMYKQLFWTCISAWHHAVELNVYLCSAYTVHAGQICSVALKKCTNRPDRWELQGQYRIYALMTTYIHTPNRKLSLWCLSFSCQINTYPVESLKVRRVPLDFDIIFPGVVCFPNPITTCS